MSMISPIKFKALIKDRYPSADILHVLTSYGVVSEYAPGWMRELGRDPANASDELSDKGEDILSAVYWELMGLSREEQIIRTQILRRQLVWILPFHGDIGLGGLITLLEGEKIPFRMTRKSLQKAHRKLKKINEAKHCTDQLPSPELYPDVRGWVQLVSQQEYKDAARHMGNCLWWSYWCQGDRGRQEHKTSIIFYNPSKRVMIDYNLYLRQIEEVEGPNGQQQEDFTPGQQAAYDLMVQDIEKMQKLGMFEKARKHVLSREVRQITRAIAQENPRKDKRMKALPKKYALQDIYDPREESIRAVDRGAGFSLSRGAFVKKHTPAWIIQRSWERYQQPDQLIRKRQEYELMLGRGRKYGTFRVTAEPTKKGIRYFVWPLVSRQRVPRAYASESTAMRRADELNTKARRPARDLPRKPYTKSELAAWLPPATIFRGRSGKLTAPGKKELKANPSRRDTPPRLRSRKNPKNMHPHRAKSASMMDVQRKVEEGDIIGLAIAMAMGPEAFYMDASLKDIDFSRLEANRGFAGPGLFFTSSGLSGVSFRGAQIRGAIFRRCSFHGTSFVGADLQGAEFKRCTLYDYDMSNFTGSNLKDATFSRCYVQLGSALVNRIPLAEAIKRGLIPGLEQDGPQIVVN